MRVAITKRERKPSRVLRFIRHTFGLLTGMLLLAAVVLIIIWGLAYGGAIS